MQHFISEVLMAIAVPLVAYILIEFRNGKCWHTRLWPIELDETLGRQVMGFASACSGIPISPPVQ